MIELQDPDCIVLSQPLHRHPAHRARSRAGHSCEQQLVGRLTRALDATAQVPPPHVQLAPMRLLGVRLASVTLALFYSRCSLQRGRRPRCHRRTSSLRP